MIVLIFFGIPYLVLLFLFLLGVFRLQSKRLFASQNGVRIESIFGNLNIDTQNWIQLKLYPLLWRGNGPYAAAFGGPLIYVFPLANQLASLIILKSEWFEALLGGAYLPVNMLTILLSILSSFVLGLPFTLLGYKYFYPGSLKTFIIITLLGILIGLSALILLGYRHSY